MAASPESHPDEQHIQRIIQECINAFIAKDVPRLMFNYAPEVVFFDMKPPFQVTGLEALRRIWEESFPYFPEKFQIETKDINIKVSGDLAFAHRLWHFTGVEKTHPALNSWIRTSTTYQRYQSRWRVVHEHVSIPFHPENSMVAYTTTV